MMYGPLEKDFHTSEISVGHGSLDRLARRGSFQKRSRDGRPDAFVRVLILAALGYHEMPGCLPTSLRPGR